MDDLSNIHENDKDPSGNLLGLQEKLILEQIVAGGPPHSQRAQSLLAIDAGVTQKIAALQSGQTVGQVSYWLSKFRKDRMGIFPEELLRQTESELPPPLQLPGQLTPSGRSEIDQQVEQDVSGEDSISPTAEVKPEEIEKKKVKSKQDKASKRSRRRLRPPKRSKREKRSSRKRPRRKRRKRTRRSSRRTNPRREKKIC
jgi:hypothetical protein